MTLQAVDNPVDTAVHGREPPVDDEPLIPLMTPFSTSATQGRKSGRPWDLRRYSARFIMSETHATKYGG